MFAEDIDLRTKPRCEEIGYESLAKVEIPKSENLNVLYLNARSIVNKLEEIQDIVTILVNIDLIIITESWLKKESSEYFQLYGFRSIHLCREGRRGGGVSFFTRDNLQMTEQNMAVNNASGAKDKQATQRGAEQTSNLHQRDAGWVFFRR